MYQNKCVIQNYTFSFRTLHKVNHTQRRKVCVAYPVLTVSYYNGKFVACLWKIHKLDTFKQLPWKLNWAVFMFPRHSANLKYSELFWEVNSQRKPCSTKKWPWRNPHKKNWLKEVNVILCISEQCNQYHNSDRNRILASSPDWNLLCYRVRMAVWWPA